jgi:hypothetical protein
LSRADKLLVRLGGLWLIGATLVLALWSWAESFCILRCREPEPVPIVLVPLGIFTLAMSRTRQRARFLLVPSAIGLAAGLSLVVVGSWAEVAAVAVDPYGPNPGTYFSQHGEILAVMSASLVALPSAAVFVGVLGRSFRARAVALLEVGVVGALAGALLGTAAGIVPGIESSKRAFTAVDGEYVVILPAGFGPSDGHCVLLGPCWSLPAEIDWFADLDGGRAIQLAVWTTVVPVGTRLASFADAQIAADQRMGYFPSGPPDTAPVAGTDGVRQAYRTEVAPYVVRGVCVVMACDDIPIWADCRFYLRDAPTDVYAQRIIAVVEGRAFVVSAFAAPEASEEAGQLLAIFAASIRPGSGATQSQGAGRSTSYPASRPLTEDTDDC